MGNVNQPGRGLDDVTAMKSWPLLFHHVHSENVELSPDWRRARRVESFCKGICFSNRPLQVNERLYVRFAEVSTAWSGVLRFGYTSINPSKQRAADLPRYACPDLTNRAGFWAKALPERYAEFGTTLFFYITRNGDVMFGINGEEKGIFFSGVPAQCPLWAVVDIYGNTTAMEFVDGQQMNNLAADGPVPIGGNLPPPYPGSLPAAHPIHPAHESLAQDVQTLSIHASGLQHQMAPPAPTSSSASSPSAQGLVPIRFHAGVTFAPIALSKVTGRNVRLNQERNIAVRKTDEYCNGYVFMQRPLQCGEKLVVQILSVDRAYVGGLAFGVTACDPEKVQFESLPDDSDLLLDRGEYWIVNKDVCSSAEVGDELSFHLTDEGEVRYGKNGHHMATLMFIDKTLPMWAFFDVYGNTQKIKILGVYDPSAPPTPRSNAAAAAAAQNEMNTAAGNSPLVASLPPRTTSTPPPRPPPPRASPAQPRRASAGVPSTTTPPSLPPKQNQNRPLPPVPQQDPFDTSPGQPPFVGRLPLVPTPVTSQSASPASQNPTPLSHAATTPTQAPPQHPPPPLPPANQILPEGKPTPPPRNLNPFRDEVTPPSQQASKTGGQSNPPIQISSPAANQSQHELTEEEENQENECKICLEADVNCVLYRCGHACMCYECAVGVKASNTALCPICRQEILDIIKIFRS